MRSSTALSLSSRSGGGLPTANSTMIQHKSKNKSIDLSMSKGQKVLHNIQRCIELEFTKENDDEGLAQQNCQTNLSSINTYDSVWLSNMNPLAGLQDKLNEKKMMH